MQPKLWTGTDDGVEGLTISGPKVSDLARALTMGEGSDRARRLIEQGLETAHAIENTYDRSKALSVLAQAPATENIPDALHH